MNPIMTHYAVELAVGELRVWTRMGEEFPRPEAALAWAHDMLQRHTEYRGYKIYRVVRQAFLTVTWNRQN